MGGSVRMARRRLSSEDGDRSVGNRAWPCSRYGRCLPARASSTARPRGRLPEARYEHFYLSLQAALAGQGTAIASKLMAGDDLKDGRLIAPEGVRRDGSSYNLLADAPIAPDSPAGAWLAWLREETAATLAD